MKKDMKKTYISPAVSIEDTTVATNILVSSGVKSEDFGIGFGGIDGDGDLSADVKEGSWDSIWD